MENLEKENLQKKKEIKQFQENEIIFSKKEK